MNNGKPNSGDPRPAAPRASRIAWLVPRPLEGSGGHRTIVQNIAALESAGHECHVYLEDPPARPDEIRAAPEKRLARMREQFQSYFGFDAERVFLGFEPRESYDLVFATAWFTAPFVARIKSPCRKAYFVQDYEASFMPVSDGYLRAEDSYRLGLSAITIGRWLTQRLAREAGCPATSFEFCADSAVYRPDDSATREDAVCAIYQPEKPRRCPGMLVRALAILKQHRPQTRVYLYGTRDKPDLPFEHEHLGLISVEQCAALYNRCRVGLCISATNPSRIPFEMMACGLPVVDVHRENNLFDMPEAGVLLANARADALARAVALLLTDEPRRAAMSAFAREFMRPRSLEHGYRQFVGAVEDLLAGRAGNWNARARQIEPMYRRPAQLPSGVDPLTGRPLPHRSNGRAGAEVSGSLARRAAALDELERIYAARSWKAVQRLKHNPLYRAVAQARFGQGWDAADPKEDPRVVLERVRNSNAFRLIAATKRTPIARLLARSGQDPADAPGAQSDPFRPAPTGEPDGVAAQR